MKSIVNELKIDTGAAIEIVDITDPVAQVLDGSGIASGAVTIFTQHTTTAININEREAGLQEDMIKFLAKFAPPEAGYLHDKNAGDGRKNAHSHISTLFMSASATIPVVDGKLAIGRWQSVFFIELDGPRKGRTVIVQANGA
jgi:secondary thiamine-phosphate synthase enzyme